MREWIALAALLGGASPLSAQSDGPPDPVSIDLPDMTPTRDPGVIADGWRHFYFHKAGVSYAEAFADFADCYHFLPVQGASPALPAFAPWSEGAGVRVIQRSLPWGLTGAVILAIVSGPIDRRDRQSRMRRCMEPRGYLRYPVSEEVWSRLIDNYSARSIALQAKAASEPAPGLDPVTQ
jgi:hypothetical protein